jgi:membrane-associated phospholipid phosphatase
MHWKSKLYAFWPPVFLVLALASPGQSQPGFQGSSGVLALGKQDYFWISAAILAAIPAQIRYSDMAPADTGSLDRRKDLWVMDRWAAGRYSPKAGLASDLLILPLAALPVAATAWDSYRGRQTWGGAFADAVVYGEAMALSSSLDLLVRSLRVHPRPLVYGKDAPAKERLSGEASGSFYSGHANAAFLSAVYFSCTYSLRHPDSDHQGLIWAGSMGAATLVAGLRVAAGKHYLSDVLTGAAAGSLFGWAFPYLHRKGGAANSTGLGMQLNGAGIYPVLTWNF